MYHVKNDKRALKSAEKIMEGLAICIKNKKIDNVGVTDIALASGVSRGTFYRLFDSPVDVLAYTCNRLAEEAMKASSDAGISNWRDYTAFSLNFCMTHSNVLETLLGSGRNDIIENTLNRFYMEKGALFNEHISNGLTGEALEYIRNSSTASICAIVFTWIKHGRKETVEELMAIHDRFFKFND